MTTYKSKIMADVQILCPSGGYCSYVTPKLPVASSMELLAMHKEIDHGQDTSVALGVKPEMFPRPKVALDEPIEKWEDFSSSWQQYKEEYCLPGKNLKRQLLACCSPDLATSLSRTRRNADIVPDEKPSYHLNTQLPCTDILGNEPTTRLGYPSLPGKITRGCHNL